MGDVVLAAARNIEIPEGFSGHLFNSPGVLFTFVPDQKFHALLSRGSWAP
jgi:hypothetical protein